MNTPLSSLDSIRLVLRREDRSLIMEAPEEFRAVPSWAASPMRVYSQKEVRRMIPDEMPESQWVVWLTWCIRQDQRGVA